MPVSYSVVIPVFNELPNINPLYKRLKGVLDNTGSAYEIIFVDDGSTDGSFDALKNIAISDKMVSVIGFTKNFGQHKAVVAGILNSRGEYLVTLDADLQNPPEEIPRLIEKIKEGFDMVSGYRKRRKDVFSRKLCSLFTNLLIALVCGVRMKDYGSMLRVFRGDVARKTAEVFLNNEGYITMLVTKVTRNISEIEVSHDERHSGESKYGIRKLFIEFFKIFKYNDYLSRLMKKRGGDKELPFIIARRIEDGEERLAAG